MGAAPTGIGCVEIAQRSMVMLHGGRDACDLGALRTPTPKLTAMVRRTSGADKGPRLESGATRQLALAACQVPPPRDASLVKTFRRRCTATGDVGVGAEG